MRATPGTPGARLAYYARSLVTLAGGVERAIPAAWTLGVRRRPHVVRFRGGPRLACRDLMDLWVAKETCLDREYERKGAPIAAGWTVLDIGAGVGDFSIVAARACAPGRVVACEPSPAALPVLRDNVLRNGVDNVEVIAAAVASSRRTVHLVIDRRHAMSTTVRGPEHAAVPVEAVTLDDLLDRLPRGRCDLLKCDCEGAEYDFLPAADDATLARIDRVVLEYHDGNGRRHADLAARLGRAGFEVRAPSVNPVHAHTGILYAERRH